MIHLTHLIYDVHMSNSVMEALSVTALEIEIEYNTSIR
jgi:hypothetical protein